MIFDNCLIQAPDGINLSRCSKKKLRWYIDRNLASMVDENTIRLKFEPSGRCGVGDPLLLDGKPNICVVCGISEDLTRHHIIPYCYIKHMDLKHKVDVIRDIFPLCKECHNRYETIVQDYRRDLAKKLGVGLSGIPDEEMKIVRRAMGSANAIKNYSAKIPAKNMAKLWKNVKEFLCKDQVSDEELEALCNYKITKRPDFLTLSQALVRSVKNYDEFSQTWREHFVNTMKPKYMPDTWTVDRRTKTENLWIPQRMLRQHHKTTLKFRQP